MTAIVATDVAVSSSHRNRDVFPVGGKIMSIVDITVGDGALTYPTGGMPLPDKANFGMKREVSAILIEQPSANGFIYKYDRENNKLKIFTQGAVTGSTAAAAAEDGALAENSAAAEGTVRLPNTVADTTYDMGGMIELPATIAPAEVTIRLLVFGE